MVYSDCSNSYVVVVCVEKFRPNLGFISIYTTKIRITSIFCLNSHYVYVLHQNHSNVFYGHNPIILTYILTIAT